MKHDQQRTAVGSDNTQQIPRVSIGLPVYNGAKTIHRAVETLLGQSLADFELIVSDNASTDGTEEICRGYAAKDSRIRYVRQARNLGALANFEFVLAQSRAEYFMWAAADDYWLPEFIEENYRVLRQEPNVALSVSQVRVEPFLWKDPKLVGTFSIQGNYLSRVRQYLACPGANSRTYGLFRRRQILPALVERVFVAGDWATMINLLKCGYFYEVPRVLMVRTLGESSKPPFEQYRRQYNLRWPRTELPLTDFTVWLWHNLARADFLRCADLIARLNTHYFWMVQRSKVRQRLAAARLMTATGPAALTFPGRSRSP